MRPKAGNAYERRSRRHQALKNEYIIIIIIIQADLQLVAFSGECEAGGPTPKKPENELKISCFIHGG